MRRIERLVNLIAALLEARRPLTAEEIRSSIAGYDQPTKEAFRRAFERDKEALRDMGIPLELRASHPLADQPDGYIIPKERYYLPELDLEPDELAALAVATETMAEGSAGSGLLKLSVGHGEVSPAGRSVIAGADVGVGDPRLVAIYSALVDRVPVEFSYLDARGNRTRRGVEPWALVHRGGYWYLSGRDAQAGARRTFKVSRMGDTVARGEGSYEIPASVDRAAGIGAEPWEFGDEDDLQVWVAFDASTRWWAEQNLGRLERREGPEGALEVRMRAANADALVGWVIGWHGRVTLRSPEMGARLRAHLAPWLGEGA